MSDEKSVGAENDPDMLLLGKLSRLLMKQEDLLTLITKRDLSFNENRLAFTMIMHAAVHHCELDSNVIAELCNTTPYTIRRYVSGESAPGIYKMPGGDALCARADIIRLGVQPLLEERIPKIREERDALRIKLEVRYELRLDLSQYDDTNVVQFPNNETPPRQ